jgi:thiamine-phosphate pyrophosphorylase
MAKQRNAGPEAAAPQLYLVVPADCPPAAFTAALETADIACVLLLGATVEVLRPLAQERGAAVLLLDRADLAAETGCDGVHLSDLKSYDAARRRLGAEAIVGVGVGVAWDDPRHDAITAAERGADYIAFGAPGPEPGRADLELLGWWQLLMNLPCVAFSAADSEDCARLASAGADFVAVGPNLDLGACQAALEKAAARA